MKEEEEDEDNNDDDDEEKEEDMVYLMSRGLLIQGKQMRFVSMRTLALTLKLSLFLLTFRPSNYINCSGKGIFEKIVDFHAVAYI